MSQSSTTNEKKEVLVEIALLGKFDISYKSQTMMDNSARNQKSLDILRYLIVNFNKEMYPEYISEAIWPDNDYSDIRNVVRTYVFRLKKFLSVDNAQAQDVTKHISISNSKGKYTVNLSKLCTLDIWAFEEAVENSENVKSPEEKEKYYIEALEIYKGSFLKGEDAQWVLPFRRYYAKMFSNVMDNLLEIRFARGDNDGIINICEACFEKNGYEGKINTYYIQALLQQKRFSSAIDYYNYFAEKSNVELDKGLSDELEKIYIKIKSSMNANRVETYEKGLNALDERKFWQMMTNLLDTYMDNKVMDVSIGHAVIVPSEGETLSKVEIFSAYESLTKSLDIVLRKDDVFTVFENVGAVFILKYVTKNYYELIIERIKDMFRNNCDLPVELKIFINPVIPRSYNYLN